MGIFYYTILFYLTYLVLFIVCFMLEETLEG